MKRIFKIASLLIAVIMAAMMGVSCGVDYTDEEIIKEAEKLIEGSFQINDIYFGKGLPIGEKDSEEAKKFAEENDFELDNVQFLPVTEESPYFSIADIKEATAKVYSKAYCESLYKTAFEGFSSGEHAVYAKYMEDESGTLTVRIDLAENALPLRTYDYSSIKVKSKKETSVKIEIDSYLDGKKEEKPVVFTLVKEENGWRLDTPTY